jgi:hypothetical protein
LSTVVSTKVIENSKLPFFCISSFWEISLYFCRASQHSGCGCCK